MRRSHSVRNDDTADMLSSSYNVRNNRNDATFCGATKSDFRHSVKTLGVANEWRLRIRLLHCENWRERQAICLNRNAEKVERAESDRRRRRSGREKRERKRRKTYLILKVHTHTRARARDVMKKSRRHAARNSPVFFSKPIRKRNERTSIERQTATCGPASDGRLQSAKWKRFWDRKRNGRPSSDKC